MRTILIVLFLIVFFIISLPVYLILLLFRKKYRYQTSVIAQKIVKYAFKVVLFFSGTKTIVLGTENVPKNTAVLYVFNHRSLMDIPLAYSTLPTVTGFIAKIEVKKVPFLSWWMELVNCLFLDRDDLKASMKTILSGIENIKEGYSMFISPEGTRNHEEEMLPFKEGSFKMAHKTNCPVIPVAISGSDDLFENSFPWVKKAITVIEYGKPIYLDTLSTEERKVLGVLSREIIAEMLQGHKLYIAGNPSQRKQQYH